MSFFKLCKYMLLFGTCITLRASEDKKELPAARDQVGFQELLISLAGCAIAENLAAIDTRSLALTCKAGLQATLPRLKYLYKISHAASLDFSWFRQMSKDDDARNDVLRNINTLFERNPGAWLKLNFSFNSVGDNKEFLKSLMKEIATCVHSQASDIVELNFSNNGLERLPSEIFAQQFSNLHNLILSFNQDLVLSNEVFAEFPYLKTLSMIGNSREDNKLIIESLKKRGVAISL